MAEPGGKISDVSGSDINKIYPLPANDSMFHYTYPVAAFDHDEGNAIAGGFEYKGHLIPQLRGKYIFGDIPGGRLFFVSITDLNQHTMARVKEWFVSMNGKNLTLRDLCGQNRVDLRFSQDANGEMFIFTKPDGKIYSYGESFKRRRHSCKNKIKSWSQVMAKTVQWALVLLSGICFYVGFSLNGNFGWLMWIAPIPVLYISLLVKPSPAFWFAFVAYLIGRMSWFSYLKSVMPVLPAIFFTILLPLIFALIILASRKIILNSQHWFSVFAYPVLFTAFEYIVFIFSRDGTAASIGYTQSNYLFLTQIASLTGILGITFLICFIPAAIVLAYYFRKSRKTAFTLVFLLLLLVGDSIIYSVIRLGKSTGGKNDPGWHGSSG